MLENLNMVMTPSNLQVVPTMKRLLRQYEAAEQMHKPFWLPERLRGSKTKQTHHMGWWACKPHIPTLKWRPSISTWLSTRRVSEQNWENPKSKQEPAKCQQILHIRTKQTKTYITESISNPGKFQRSLNISCKKSHSEKERPKLPASHNECETLPSPKQVSDWKIQEWVWNPSKPKAATFILGLQNFLWFFKLCLGTGRQIGHSFWLFPVVVWLGHVFSHTLDTHFSQAFRQTYFCLVKHFTVIVGIAKFSFNALTLWEIGQVPYLLVLGFGYLQEFVKHKRNNTISEWQWNPLSFQSSISLKQNSLKKFKTECQTLPMSGGTWEVKT